MTRGRKPIPDQIKALKGNPGKRRLRAQQLADWGRTADDHALPVAAPPHLLPNQNGG